MSARILSLNQYHRGYVRKAVSRFWRTAVCDHWNVLPKSLQNSTNQRLYQYNNQSPHCSDGRYHPQKRRSRSQRALGHSNVILRHASPGRLLTGKWGAIRLRRSPRRSRWRAESRAATTLVRRRERNENRGDRTSPGKGRGDFTGRRVKPRLPNWRPGGGVREEVVQLGNGGLSPPCSPVPWPTHRPQLARFCRAAAMAVVLVGLNAAAASAGVGATADEVRRDAEDVLSDEDYQTELPPQGHVASPPERRTQRWPRYEPDDGDESEPFEPDLPAVRLSLPEGLGEVVKLILWGLVLVGGALLVFYLLNEVPRLVARARDRPGERQEGSRDSL